jgi:hypothetical protein
VTEDEYREAWEYSLDPKWLKPHQIAMMRRDDFIRRGLLPEQETPVRTREMVEADFENSAVKRIKGRYSSAEIADILSITKQRVRSILIRKNVVSSR